MIDLDFEAMLEDFFRQTEDYLQAPDFGKGVA